MDEILDVAELFVDLGLGELIAWLLRIVGVISLVAGVVVFLATDITVVVPVALVVVGLVLLFIPTIFVQFLELI
jgi:hypothetical protein